MQSIEFAQNLCIYKQSISDERYLFRILRITGLKQKKTKPPDLIKWKSLIQEVKVMEKGTHKIRNMEDVFEKRWTLTEGKI